jgi:LmbE family N-acetylglucosaminyl deacetylase
MISARFPRLESVLCLGAHPDDIEIGCGGTLLKWLREFPSVAVHWVVLSGHEERAAEARRSAEAFLQDAAQSHVIVENFRDSFFPYEGARIKEFFRRLRGQLDPDVVFTHRREDFHQDHRLVAELTWNTFRNHVILEYEIPKYEGDLGTPNIFVSLPEATCRRKIELLLDSFPTQHAKPWFRSETFWSLLRIRGIEAASPTGLAEALYCRKLAL